MFADLFSSLDGAFKMYLWLPSMATLFFLVSYNLHLHNCLSSLRHSLNSVWLTSSSHRFNGFNLFLCCLFTSLLISNVFGLAPLVYTLTSDLMPMLGLSLLFWFFLLLSGLCFNFKQTLAHLAPSGAPFILLPFLILIELISTLIRPITLAVRLIANVSAGHIVLGLISNTLTTYFLTSSNIFLLAIMTGYMLFEFFVAFIQAYIFSLLVSLYQSEHP
uniref:ATP synthase subunit a n=1 Tax=Helix pomatia TaxID=6536 RepID=A0A481YLK6_HELPO|nr:ATP synthase membrane subunit 6 [Helix pomatia]